MKKSILVSLLVLLSICAPMSGFARQSDDEKQAAMMKFQAKIHQLELFNMILPIAMTKDQLRTILKVVEKCHAHYHDVLDLEYKAMKLLLPKVDDAISDALGKGAVPTQSLVTQLYNASNAAIALRQGINEESTDDIYAAVIGSLNKGQLTAMANSLDPREFPELLKKPEEVSQEDRIRIFIRAVFLDKAAYDLLAKMSI